MTDKRLVLRKTSAMGLTEFSVLKDLRQKPKPTKSEISAFLASQIHVCALRSNF
jgi:hypothetical protein